MTISGLLDGGNHVRTEQVAGTGRLLVGCNSYLKPRLWDTQTWDVVATAPSTAMAAAFSPDGKQLALASAWNVELWDVATLLTASK